MWLHTSVRQYEMVGTVTKPLMVSVGNMVSSKYIPHVDGWAPGPGLITDCALFFDFLFTLIKKTDGNFQF